MTTGFLGHLGSCRDEKLCAAQVTGVRSVVSATYLKQQQEQMAFQWKFLRKEILQIPDVWDFSAYL